MDARQMGILAHGGRVSAIVGRDNGRGQVSGVRITLVAAPVPQADPPSVMAAAHVGVAR